MLRVLRITLMWLVALAVPVQGYAAVTMLGCGPGHHDSAVSQSPVAIAGGNDVAVSPHSHESHAVLAGQRLHDDAAEPDHAHALKSHGKAGKGPCTPCASCCVVAALPATTLVFQAIPLLDFFVPLAPRGMVSFLTEGPERPPRSVLV